MDEINALGLEQFISDMQAGNISRESIAPILKIAQKVQLQAQENQLTVSTGLGEDRIQLRVTSQNGLLHTAELSGLTMMGQPSVIFAQMNHVDNGVPDITNDGSRLCEYCRWYWLCKTDCTVGKCQYYGIYRKWY